MVQLNNHIAAVCGHTYPFCLARHANASRKCLIADCEIPFSSDWCAAWGIRTPKVDVFEDSKAIDAAKTRKFVHTRCLACKFIMAFVRFSCYLNRM